VNVKRVYRLYLEEGFECASQEAQAPGAEPRLLRANQEWAMDFIVDGLATGRMVRILSVVDASTRELHGAGSRHQPGQWTGDARCWTGLIEERGRPENVLSDNGPSSSLAGCWAGPSLRSGTRRAAVRGSHQPSTAKRNSSYEWVRKRGHVRDERIPSKTGSLVLLFTIKPLKIGRKEKSSPLSCVKASFSRC